MSRYASACLCLVLTECLYYPCYDLDNDEDEITIAGFYWRRSGLSYIAQDPGQTNTKASHPDACYYTYHHLSCMFLLLKFYKNGLNKTIFVVAITIIIII